MGNHDVYISKPNWKKILDYAATAYQEWKTEIGGMAIVYKDKEGDYIIEEPVILKQEVSGGNTVLDQDALAQYYVDTAMKHKDKLDLQFLWWHSHHTMAAFWSGTDLSAIDEFSDGKISMSLVVNLREEYKFRINVWDPILAHEDIDLNIMDAPKLTPSKETDKEVKALCSKITSTYTNNIGRMSYSKQQEQAELFAYNKSFGVATLDDDDKAMFMNEIAIKIDNYIEKVCSGEFNYNQFKYRMNQIVKEIDESKHVNIELCVPTKKHLLENAMMLTWADLLIDVDDCIDRYADWGDYH